MARPALAYSEGARGFFALAILMVVFTTLSVVGRYVSHRMQKTRWGWDDWLIVAALLFYYIMIAISLWGFFVGGVGQNDGDVTYHDKIILEKQLLILQFPYAFVLALARISIAVFMLKIFPQRWIRIVMYLTIFSNTAWWLFVVIDALAICVPLSGNWDPQNGPSECGDFNASYIANATWGIINDLILFAAPQFIVWNLKTTWLRRIVLSGVFALGIFDIAVSFTRLCKIVNLTIDNNFAGTLAPAEIWSFLETGVAIIVACLPLCRPILDKLVPRSGIHAARQGLSRSRRALSSSNGTKSNRDGKDKDKELRDILESGGDIHISRTVDQHYDVTERSSADGDLVAVLAGQGGAVTEAHASIAPPRNRWGSVNTEARVELEEQKYQEEMARRDQELADAEALEKEDTESHPSTVSTLPEERNPRSRKERKMTLMEMLRQ